MLSRIKQNMMLWGCLIITHVYGFAITARRFYQCGSVKLSQITSVKTECLYNADVMLMKVKGDILKQTYFTTAYWCDQGIEYSLSIAEHVLKCFATDFPHMSFIQRQIMQEATTVTFMLRMLTRFADPLAYV